MTIGLLKSSRFPLGLQCNPSRKGHMRFLERIMQTNLSSGEFTLWDFLILRRGSRFGSNMCKWHKICTWILHYELDFLLIVSVLVCILSYVALNATIYLICFIVMHFVCRCVDVEVLRCIGEEGKQRCWIKKRSQTRRIE